MKTMQRNVLAGLLVTGLLIPLAASAEPMSFGEDRDIGALMDEAASRFQLDQQDAVILFEGQKVTFFQDGRAATTHHRIVWIGTEMGIRRYADLRIPFDSKNTIFSTLTLRTWRDSRWWVSGDTAKVETLPFAVAQAADYTHLRDMMLLHDGIELPCILEMAFSIEDQQAFRGGIQGAWVFPKRDPILRSALTIDVSKGTKLTISKSSAVPQATVSENANGYSVHHWEMGPLDHLGLPETDDPASYCPHVAYSTFEDWKALATQLQGAFEPAMSGVDAITQAASWNMCDAPNLDCAAEIAGFVAEKTRWVHTDSGFWMHAPRQASRTFETAYGHALDRAILAAALLRDAGFSVSFVFRGKGWNPIDEGVATLDRLEGPAVLFGDAGAECVFDPVSATISNDAGWARGRSLWTLGPEPPSVKWDTAKTDNALSIKLDLSWNADENRLEGTGTLTSSGTLNAFDAMYGAQDQTLKALGGVVGSVWPGAKVTAFNPQHFGRDGVALAFSVEAKSNDKDDLDRVVWTVGQPSGGLIDHLGHDVAIEMDARTSPVTLPSPMSQTLQVSVDLGEAWDVLWVPPSSQLENDGGRFSLTTSSDADKIVLTRSLAVKTSRFSAESWPTLRELLLAATHEQNATVLLKPKP